MYELSQEYFPLKDFIGVYPENTSELSLVLTQSSNDPASENPEPQQETWELLSLFQINFESSLISSLRNCYNISDCMFAQMKTLRSYNYQDSIL